MHLFILSLVISLVFSPLAANPFALNVPQKENLTIEDYVEVQKQLQMINPSSLVQEMHAMSGNVMQVEIFEARCNHGIKQTIIDVEKDLIPHWKLEKIGKGGDRCIVSYVPFAGNELGRSISNYVNSIETILEALKATGFNGYFYYMIGGFPNPTGKEIQYAGVPYAGKIFMMLEAQRLGFKNVLWIDSSLLPLRSPSSFFVWIETKGYFLRGGQPVSNASLIFPETRILLQKMTGVDVLNTPYIDSHIFGLQLDTPLAQKLIKDYYEMVELGTPFLSCFPEDFVLSAILGQPEFSAWKPFNMDVFVQTYEAFPSTEETVQFLKKRRSVLLSTDAVILYPRFLKNQISCSCLRAAARVGKVPKFLRLPVFGFILREYSRYFPDASLRIIRTSLRITSQS